MHAYTAYEDEKYNDYLTASVVNICRIMQTFNQLEY